jgi:hypothetical protein
MPMPCQVCTHRNRKEIDQALVERRPVMEIIRQYAPDGEISKWSMRRHRLGHLPATMVKAKEAEDVTEASSLLRELERCIARVNKLYDACDRYLTDPDNSEQYDVGPRAEDIEVTYDEFVDGRRLRRKARLSTLLEEIQTGERIIERTDNRAADPRELILKTSRQLHDHITLLGEIRGELKRQQTVNILVTPQFQTIVATIDDLLQPYPELRVRFSERLGALEAGSHDTGS